MKQSQQNEGIDKDSLPLIRLDGLKKYYPLKSGIVTRTTGHVRAVDGIDLAIRAGETLGLVGESGCGKSTVGRLIVGLERPTEGRVRFEGRDLTGLLKRERETVRTKLQMVFQDSYSSLNPRKHIYEILSQPMIYHGLASKDNIRMKVEEILDMVGLSSSVLGRYPHEFSGGQRQRICIARALSVHPEFIVCDEPVSALDVSIQAQILNLLRQLQEELHLTCLFIGHGLGAVKYVSDRIAVMYLGKIVEVADAVELFSHPVHPYTRAICQASPGVDPGPAELKAALLEGEAASGSHVPSGCRFHPRCPYAEETCREKEPGLISVSDSSRHMVACPVTVSEEQPGYPYENLVGREGALIG